MEIKRNIFDSSARMPERYEPIASSMAAEQEGAPYLRPNPAQINSDVHHARCPRIGEK